MKTPMLSSFLNVIFPNSCLRCQNLIHDSHQAFCLNCYYQLPFTHWKWDNKNQMYNKLHAFVPIENANSLFYFRKGNSIQRMLHSLKYHNRRDLSRWLAQEFFTIAEMTTQHDIDCITSVPIHPKKLRERGYNQNSDFGKVLAEQLNIEYDEKVLKRTRHQKSQTLLHKAERMKRLENTFEINKIPKDFTHYLLIDDVCTTGSTLLHCADLLLKQNKKVSIATMAFAI